MSDHYRPFRPVDDSLTTLLPEPSFCMKGCKNHSGVMEIVQGLTYLVYSLLPFGHIDEWMCLRGVRTEDKAVRLHVIQSQCAHTAGLDW